MTEPVVDPVTDWLIVFSPEHTDPATGEPLAGKYIHIVGMDADATRAAVMERFGKFFAGQFATVEDAKAAGFDVAQLAEVALDAAPVAYDAVGAPLPAPTVEIRPYLVPIDGAWHPIATNGDIVQVARVAPGTIEISAYETAGEPTATRWYRAVDATGPMPDTPWRLVGTTEASKPGGRRYRLVVAVGGNPDADPPPPV